MSKAVSRESLAGYWVMDAPLCAEYFKAKNDHPLVGFIGAGGEGSGNAQQARHFGDVAAVCDADLAQAEKANAAFGGNPTMFQDYRKLLETRPDIDVIINSTPEH